MRGSLYFACLMWLAWMVPDTALAAPGHPTTNRLIVRFKDTGVRRLQGARPQRAMAGMVTAAGDPLTFVRRFGANGMVLGLPDEMPLEEAQRLARDLLDDPEVESAEPDRRLYPALVPNDTRYAQQWYLFESPAGIRAQEAWDRSTGSSGLVIAMLDTGILAHRDLDSAARVLPGYDFISDPFTANDGDGRDPDPSDPGDAFADDECGPGVLGEPSSWHGTSVAGVMVAQSDNNQDIAGLDFAARLLPVRVLGKCGGFVSDIADAMRWAAGLPVQGIPANPNPARVINLSLSGDGACSEQEQAAIDDAVTAGAVVVVAAGNEAGDVANQSPANCNNVITVGALARDGSRASYVNVGTAVDLSAPGGDGDLATPDGDGILTLSNTGTSAPAGDALVLIQGTSFTTAQVSAVASLMLSLNAGLNACLIEGVLKATVQAFPDASCNSTICGAGLLDADAALAGASDPAALPGVVSQCSTDSGGGGGGGCVLASNGRFDPLWLLLPLVAVWRRRAGRRIVP